MSSRRSLILGITSTLLLAGCASPTFYSVLSDGLVTPNLESSLVGKTVSIVPMSEAITTENMVFQATANSIAEVLKKHGMQVVENAADYILKVDFGISGSGRRSTSSSTPIYGATQSTTYLPGGRTATTMGTGVIGVASVSGSYSTYMRWLTLVMSPSQSPEREVWRLGMTSEGSKNSYLALLPKFMKTLDARFAKNAMGEEDSYEE